MSELLRPCTSFQRLTVERAMGCTVTGHMLSESSFWVLLLGILCSLKAMVPYSSGAIKTMVFILGLRVV